MLQIYQDGVKKVQVDSNPFLEAESHFVNAKFYLKNDNILEDLPVENLPYKERRQFTAEITCK